MTLVQGAVIGGCVILSVVAIVLLQMFLRSRATDVMTLADIARVQSALEFTYAVNTEFPQTPQALVLGSAENKTERLCERGFMSRVEPCERVVLPAMPAAGKGGYTYHSFDAGQEYGIEFILERNHRSLGLMKGVVCAFSQGLAQGPCLTQ